MTTVGTREDSTDAGLARSENGEPVQAQNPDSPSATDNLSQPLQITSVRWGRTVNTGNYSSVRLDVEAYVATGGDPESTLEALDHWVAERLPMSDYDRQNLEVSMRQRQAEYEDLAEKTMQMRRVFENIKRYCDINGVELPRSGLEDLPF